MASKNISIVLFLTINLVFFGSTAAQAPAPEPAMCPIDSPGVTACINVLSLVNLKLALLTRDLVKPCCEVMATASIPTSVATVCICDAVKARVLNVVDVFATVSRFLQLCDMPPPDRETCN